MSTSQQHAMEDPDHGWKPNNRPQSTVARNFMSELDDLFKLDGSLDLLDKNVHEKKQAVTKNTRELEELEARLRATEERLKQAKTSPPRRKDSQRRTPVQGAFPEEDKARLAGAKARDELQQAKNTADRPRTAQDGGEESA